MALNPDLIPRLNRLRAQLAATGVTVGFRSVDGVLSPVWPDGATPTAADRTKVDAVFASFRIDDASFDEDAEIDAVPDAIVDMILAAKALPPNATAAEVRERAKTDRRARRVRP